MNNYAAQAANAENEMMKSGSWINLILPKDIQDMKKAGWVIREGWGGDLSQEGYVD